jgi:hypothetical protein
MCHFIDLFCFLFGAIPGIPACIFLGLHFGNRPNDHDGRNADATGKLMFKCSFVINVLYLTILSVALLIDGGLAGLPMVLILAAVAFLCALPGVPFAIIAHKFTELLCGETEERFLRVGCAVMGIVIIYFSSYGVLVTTGNAQLKEFPKSSGGMYGGQWKETSLATDSFWLGQFFRFASGVDRMIGFSPVLEYSYAGDGGWVTED